MKALLLLPPAALTLLWVLARLAEIFWEVVFTVMDACYYVLTDTRLLLSFSIVCIALLLGYFLQQPQPRKL